MSLELPDCGICEKPVNTDKDDYEWIEYYIKGELEESGYIHTKCRNKQEERISKRQKNGDVA